MQLIFKTFNTCKVLNNGAAKRPKMKIKALLVCVILV
jgi:hypothetical protein